LVAETFTLVTSLATFTVYSVVLAAKAGTKVPGNTVNADRLLFPPRARTTPGSGPISCSGVGFADNAGDAWICVTGAPITLARSLRNWSNP